MQSNDPLHPGTVLSSFLHHLGQLILLIIAPHDTDDAPPFLQHPEIYGIEFWHAHLNYACTRFAVSHGPDRPLGNQICYWTTGTCETCMKVTHLVVFLPSALGAYVLFRHRTKVSSSLSSADDIQRRMDRTLFGSTRAPSGPLLPFSSTKLNKSLTHVVVLLKAVSLLTPSPFSRILRYGPVNRVAWTLKFTLPTLAEEGTTRRFSAVPREYGPSGAQALEGAVRYALVGGLEEEYGQYLEYAGKVRSIAHGGRSE